MQIKRLTLAITATVIASQAGAGGFALSEQSVSAGGTANAGRASNAMDASVVYGNPAAMVNLKEAQFTQALAFIDASTKITPVAGGIGTTNNGDIVPHTFIPSGYFTSGDQGGWAWGVAAYGSFGLKTNNESTFAGRYLGDKSSVQVITVQPALSYRINDKVSVGIGPTFNRLDALLTKDTTAGAVGIAKIEGDDIGYGYNLGIHAQITPTLSTGLVYRSKVKYKIDDGSFNVTGGTLTGGAPISASASTSITLPESVEMSLSQKLDARTTLHAGATWTRWSRFKDLTVSTTAPGSLATVQEVFDWKDSMGYAVGVTHACTDKLELRAGLAYDNTPVAPEHRSVRLPSADRRIASVGAGYKLSPSQTIDVSYTYLNEEKAEVRQPAGGGFPAYSADYRNKASIYGLQFTQKF